jgi:4-coumarate--CoA ligase
MSSGHCFVPAVFFGIIASGGVFSAASHSFTPHELARQIKQGQSNLVICSEDLKDVAIEAAKISGIPQSRVVVLGSEPPWNLQSVEGGLSLKGEQRLPFPRVTEREELKNSLIMLLWSSGTTGVPKGVMLSHLNLVAELFIPMIQGREWAAPLIESGELVPPELRTLAHLPIAHIAGILGKFQDHYLSSL